MYKSTDGGRTWTPHRARRHAADRAHPGRSARSRRSSSSPRSAIRTARTPSAACSARRTAARSWQKVLGKDDDTGAIDLAFDPANPRRDLRRALADAAPTLERLSAVERPGQRLYKSTDGGDTGRRSPATAFPAQPGRIGLAVAPSRRERVYAIVDATRRRAASTARTTAGATWTHASGDPRIWQRGWYFGGITVDPQERRPRLRAATRSFYRSRRRRARPSCRSRARPAATTTTSCGSTRATRSGRSSASTRARWSR